MWMNEDEIERMLNRFDEDTNLITGARILYRLMRWTNSHSDGWPYWQKPSRAANRLMELLQSKDDEYRRTGDVADVDYKDLQKTLTPIKAFLTREGVAHSEVFL
jgi:hypothetical protein